MTQPLLRPCGQHSHVELVHVVRAFMQRCPEFRKQPQSEPGTCQVCGHAIPAYRVFGLDESGPIDVELGTPTAQKVARWLSGEAVQPDGVTIFAQHTCAAAQDERVWREARSGKAAPSEPTRNFSEPADGEDMF